MTENKKYYWLKLKEDFFRNKKIKKLRKIAGGDTFTIIYLKMQLLSIRKGGVIEFEGTESDLVEQLSLELDEEVENVKLTLAFLSHNKLIEQITNDEYLLNKVPELIGSETDAAERMRKMRGKRNKVTPQLRDVAKCYTEIEKELELEKELEKEIEKTPFESAIDDFKDYRKKIKAPMTDKAVQLLYTKLNKLASDDETKIEILNQSIVNGWKGIFPVKTQKQEPESNNPFL